MGQGNSGFVLSATTLARIAALGAPFGLEIYSENVETELELWTQKAQRP